jgi:hypothetical protein
MIAEITQKYTKQARLNSEINDNIYDSFNDLISKIEVSSSIKQEGLTDLNHGIFMYVEDLKHYIRGMELQLKREILEGTLKV